MHNYSIDCDNKLSIQVWLALLSIGLAILISKLGISNWQVMKEYDWLIGLPTTFSIFLLLNKWVDNSYWRKLSKWGWIDTPDMNGRYKGTLTTTYDGQTAQRDVELTIKQTWYKISIHLRTEHSFSHSQMAAIITTRNSNIYLQYQYLNDEIKLAVSDYLHVHKGAAILSFDKADKSFTGTYFTDQHRKNYGELSLSYIK